MRNKVCVRPDLLIWISWQWGLFNQTLVNLICLAKESKKDLNMAWFKQNSLALVLSITYQILSKAVSSPTHSAWITSGGSLFCELSENPEGKYCKLCHTPDMLFINTWVLYVQALRRNAWLQYSRAKYFFFKFCAEKIKLVLLSHRINKNNAFCNWKLLRLVLPYIFFTAEGNGK